MNPHQPFRMSLTLLAAAIVLLVAALAGGSLWILRDMHNQLAHATATRAVLDRGSLIAGYLARQAATFPSDTDTSDWNRFSDVVRSLHTVESGIQYVSIARDGVVVFHEQPGGLPTPGSDADAKESVTPPPDLRLIRRLIDVGTNMVPVVVFAAPIHMADGVPASMEVGLRRETVGREEQSAAASIRSIFRLSLATILLSFGICAALIVWIMRREAARLRQRREEEHLAFSGILANGIVHDFRNPMSALKLDVQMMQREANRGADARMDRLSHLATRVTQTVERMDSIFQEFLYLSRPATDKREPIDLNTLVRECIDMTMPRFEQAGVRPELELPETGPRVIASVSALRRALINVIINAEQFSPKAGTVTVRVVRDGGTAHVDIMDQGPGIARGEQKRVFDMFVSTRPEGTGLGLFLARTAIERSGGSIRIMEPSRRGSWFRITLPLAGEGNEGSGTA